MGSIAGFVIWTVVACFFVGHGISCFFAKEATGFWANARTKGMKDVKKYNRAMGKLWLVYGAGLEALGVPLLLAGQDSPWLMLTIVGVMLEAIAMMLVYSLYIERKYSKE